MFDDFMKDYDSLRSFATKDVRETLKAVYDELEQPDTELSLSDIEDLRETVENAALKLDERRTFVEALGEKRVRYVGRHYSKELDRIMRSRPDQDIYLFHFKFADIGDQQSETWKLFRSLAAYAMEADNCLCVAVSTLTLKKVIFGMLLLLLDVPEYV